MLVKTVGPVPVVQPKQIQYRSISLFSARHTSTFCLAPHPDALGKPFGVSTSNHMVFVPKLADLMPQDKTRRVRAFAHR